MVALGGQDREKELTQVAYEKWWQATRKLQDTQLRFNLIWKLAYTHGIRAVLQVIIGFRLMAHSDAGMLQDADILARLRYTFEITMEMLIGDGNLLTLHAMTEHVEGTARRICDLLDALDDSEVDELLGKDLAVPVS